MAAHSLILSDNNDDIANLKSSILSSDLHYTCTESSSLKRKRPPNIKIPNVLQEIKIDKFRDFKAPKETVSFWGFGFAVFSVKGKKTFMEDTHKIVPSLEGNPKKGFFGVYDGHGGKKAAEFVADNLHTNILQMMENCQEYKAKEEAVKAGYLKTDEEFLKQGIGSGTCCVTALIEGHEIVVSNLGDCRAVLSRSGVAEVLTRDHRVELEDERKRIEDKGGYVEIHRGVWRVHGILSVSRSIGDAHLKDWVIAEPDTKILKLTADMEFLVLASDGLWEEIFVTNGKEKPSLNHVVKVFPLLMGRASFWIEISDNVGDQEAVDTVTRFCQSGQKPGSSGDVQKDIDDDYGRVNISPSSKLRRISLVKQPRGMNESTGYRKTLHCWNEAEDDFACENESPPSKSRRISLVKRVNLKKEIPNEESNSCKKKTAPGGLLAACKELANLALSKGTLDDITVIIIDLNHFRCEA